MDILNPFFIAVQLLCNPLLWFPMFGERNCLLAKFYSSINIEFEISTAVK